VRATGLASVTLSASGFARCGLRVGRVAFPGEFGRQFRLTGPGPNSGGFTLQSEIIEVVEQDGSARSGNCGASCRQCICTILASISPFATRKITRIRLAHEAAALLSSST
jgi:hypothetical protein